MLSLEYQTLVKLGIRFKNLDAGRFQRTFTRHSLPSLLRIPKGYVQALRMLNEFKPDIVVGFGGYVSFPVIAVAKLMGVPTVIHEQTLGAGQTNKLLSPFVDKICVSWEQSLNYFPKNKTVLTGNPIRQSIFEEIDLPEGDGKLIFIMGGSSGSHFINVLMEKVLDELLPKYRIIHQTGDTKEYSDYEKLTAQLSLMPEGLISRYMPRKFIDPSSIGFVMEKADLVISRAGINTISELIRFKKPAILIPLPTGQKKEQERNANFLKSLGLGEVLNQKLTTSVELLSTISNMFENLDNYRIIKENILRNDSAKRIVNILINATNKKTKAKS
ncbi:MAG: hypothetical protein UU15_C0059G0003 [Candidatus Levybacteria bacterium GW2011_GWC2_40_7]|nr:MAG: hypothetical protein UU15_C0059G0003 [Candidatus Levybacteria bacterium GW2011_GWC2_40_7]